MNSDQESQYQLIDVPEVDEAILTSIIDKWREIDLFKELDRHLSLNNFDILYTFHSFRVCDLLSSNIFGSNIVSYKAIQDIFIGKNKIFDHTLYLKDIIQIIDDRETRNYLYTCLCKKTPISFEFLKELNYKVSYSFVRENSCYPHNFGELRTTYAANTFGWRNSIEAYKLPEEIDRVLHTYNRGISNKNAVETFKQTLRLFANLLILQPFFMENERTCLALLNYVLLLVKLPPIIPFSSEQENFRNAMRHYADDISSNHVERVVYKWYLMSWYKWLNIGAEDIYTQGNVNDPEVRLAKEIHEWYANSKLSLNIQTEMDAFKKEVEAIPVLSNISFKVPDDYVQSTAEVISGLIASDPVSFLNPPAFNLVSSIIVPIANYEHQKEFQANFISNISGYLEANKYYLYTDNYARIYLNPNTILSTSIAITKTEINEYRCVTENPMLIIHFVSQNDYRMPENIYQPFYLVYNQPEFWLVDPIKGTISTYILRKGVYVVTNYVFVSRSLFERWSTAEQIAHPRVVTLHDDPKFVVSMDILFDYLEGTKDKPYYGSLPPIIDEEEKEQTFIDFLTYKRREGEDADMDENNVNDGGNNEDLE